MSFAAFIQRAKIERPVKLHSGTESNFYYDVKGLYLNGGAPMIIKHLNRLVSSIATIDARICGIPLGGLLIASGLLAQDDWWSGIVVRDKVNEHGQEKLIEGHYEKESHAVLIDDVTTTGQSFLNMADVLLQNGITTKYAVCVVDRSNGAAKRLLEVAGIELLSLHIG